MFFYGANEVHPPKRDPKSCPEAEETERENEYMIGVLSREVLELFEDPYANRHLVYAIVELVVGDVFPELRVDADGEAQGNVARLLEERGVLV